MASEEAMRSVMGVIHCSQGVARKLLEGTGNDVEAAIGKFYAEQGEDEGQPKAASSSRGYTARARSGNPIVRGLGDVGGSDSDDDEPHNDYYAGGEKSGQLVRGAAGDRRPEDTVEGLFEVARRGGAAQGTSADLSNGEPGFKSFTGRGQSLSGAVVPGAPPPRAARPPVVITFYADGVFTVDNGPPRSIMDPENQDFMESIVRGECPAEIDPGLPGQEVKVNLVRKESKYEPPAAPPTASFVGAGNRLGASPSPAGAPAPAPATATEPWQGPDESQPTTSVQIRLSDGSRLTAKFNLTSTVGDLRRFISTARPDVAQPFRLAAAFPPAELVDDAATIQGAGLANAVVQQKPV